MKMSEIEEKALEIEGVVNQIVNKYSSEVDKIMISIINALKDVANPITDDELEEIVLKLSTQIYFLNSVVENVGIRADITETANNILYNQYYNELEKGTVQERTSYANSKLAEDNNSYMIYKRSYNILKNKVNSAYEVLSSVKKVLNKRIAEIEQRLKVGVREDE